MNNDVITVDDLSKVYRLYDNPVDRLKEALHPLKKKYHRDFYALNQVSFSVQKGETVGIIGKNGAGKSTLLKILTGVLTPSSGHCHVTGRVLALLELGAGFNPELSGIENIFFNGAILGMPEEEIKNKLSAILEFADIGDFVHQPVKTYSSGMYVRLAFAIIANLDADVLIIDEALAVGDAFFTQKCMRFLRKFKEIGTIIFVSHDVGSVLNLCDRAIWLEGGSCRASGSPKDVCDEYLEAIIEDKQGTATFLETKQSAIIEKKVYKDQRLEWINRSPLRNDMEVFVFDESRPSFGKGGGRIIDVSLCSTGNEYLSWVVGGTNVRLKVHVGADTILTSPIIGFFVKDRLGQILFGDNTQFVEPSVPALEQGEQVVVTFEFTMPLLPVGEYSVCAAIADGTVSKHVQHHWMHDALAFKVHSSSVASGLAGIPMKNITMTRVVQ